MKYFTDKKLQDNTAYIDYENYCRSIWADLPNELKYLQGEMLPEDLVGNQSICLHDGRILNYENNNDLNQVNLTVGIDHLGDWKTINIQYSDAKCVKCVPNKRLTDKSDSPDDDIMFHEITKGEDNDFLHSILFAGGEEIIINFNKITIKE